MIIKRTAWLLMIAGIFSFAACDNASNSEDEQADREYEEMRDSMLHDLESDQSMEMDNAAQDTAVIDTSLLPTETDTGMSR